MIKKLIMWLYLVLYIPVALVTLIVYSIFGLVTWGGLKLGMKLYQPVFKK